MPTECSAGRMDCGEASGRRVIADGFAPWRGKMGFSVPRRASGPGSKQKGPRFRGP